MRPLGSTGGPRCCHGVSPQVVVTGMLQLCLLAIADKGNNPTLLGTQAIVTGILVVIIGISLGMNSGYAINPSRDLPPRFFTFLAGCCAAAWALFGTDLLAKIKEVTKE